MLDPDLLALKMHQRELWQEAAKHALVRSLTAARPPWRERWLRYFKQFLPHRGLRAPVLPAMRVVPAVVYTAKHRYGGSNRWQNR
jgi:hypothetical protein